MPEIIDSIQTPMTEGTSALRSVMPETSAPWSAEESAVCVAGRAVYADGMAPRERAALPGYDSGVSALLLALLLFVAVNFKHYSTFLKSMAKDLFSTRRRPNVFDDHTVSETRIMASLLLVTCFSEAALLFSLIRAEGLTQMVFPLLSALLVGAMAFYAAQLAAYRTVGYVFADGPTAEQWLKGFKASQSLLGLGLIVPALVTLFYPGLSGWMLGVGAVMYLAARIIFISKGFKVFYHKIFSLLYFILYLCALEIAPLLAVVKAGRLLSYI